MSKYFEEEQLKKYFINQEKPDFKYLNEEGRMSKIDYIIWKLEKIENLLKSLVKN